MADWLSGTSQSLAQDISLKVVLSFFSQKDSFNYLLDEYQPSLFEGDPFAKL